MVKKFMVVADHSFTNEEGFPFAEDIEELYGTFTEAFERFNKLVAGNDYQVVIVYRFFTDDKNEAGTPMLVFSELLPNEGDVLSVRA